MEIFTPEQLAEVKAYHGPGYVFAALDALLWPLVLLVLIVATPRLFFWCERVSGTLAARSNALTRALTLMWRGSGWAAALLFGAVLFGALTLLYLPSDVYFEYFHEHEFGLSKETPLVFAADHLKGLLFFAGSVACLVFGMFGLARRLTSWWWIIGLVAAVGLLGSSMIDPYRNRLYFAQRPLPQGDLRDAITGLMREANIDFRDVLVEETSEHSVRLQAYFAGQGPTRTIVLNDSLIKSLALREVLAAVAHEAGHVHERRWLGRLGSSVALFVFLGLVEVLFRRSARRRWLGITERADVRALPLILLMFDVGITLAAPVSGWQSRLRESEADQYAVALTKDPEAFRSMLVKATRINKMDPDPPRWIVWKGRSHPPMAERIDAIR